MKIKMTRFGWKCWVLGALVAVNSFVASAQRNRQRDRSGPSQSSNYVPTQQSNAPAATGYARFRLISDRNIFNPNRRPPRLATAPRRIVESFSLVGTMSYEKGTFAFFDGTGSPDYRKVVEPGDSNTIAGFKITNIEHSSVKLSTPTNEFLLNIGMQMRRGDDGKWTLGAASESYGSAYAGNSNRRDFRRGDFGPMNSQPGYTVFVGTNDMQTALVDGAQVDLAADPAMNDMTADPGSTNEPPDLSGETDPVVLRLMQQRMNQAPPPPPDNN